MAKFTKAYPAQVNIALLVEELRLQFPEVVRGNGYCEIHNVQAGDEATIDAIIAAHDHTQLSTEQQNESEDRTALQTLLASADGDVTQQLMVRVLKALARKRMGG